MLEDIKIYLYAVGLSSPQVGDMRVSQTTNLSVPVGANGTQYDNIGATGEVDFTLPPITAAQVGVRFGFCCAVAQTVKVIALAGVTIGIGTTTSAAAGNAQSNSPLSYVELEAISATQWVAKYVTGTWVVT